MAEFGLVEPFGIDNGELDNFERHQCFVLGVEFAMFRQKLLENHSAFTDMVCDLAPERIVAMCERHGRCVETREKFDGWVSIWVGPVPCPPVVEDGGDSQ